MLESPTFAHAFHDSISTTMDLLYQFGYSPIFHNSVEKNADVNDYEVEELLPLVNVLTQIKKTVMPTFYNNYVNNNNETMAMKNEWTIISSMLEVDTQQQQNKPNMYISQLESIPAVLELGDACMME